MRIDWSNYFLGIAEAVSKRSPDAKLQVGCVITCPQKRIVATGYNCTPAKFDDSAVNWFDSEAKNLIVIHSEANAIIHASASNLRGASLYCTHSPCIQCAKLIAGSGITSVCYRNKYRDSEQAIDFLRACKIDVAQEPAD